MLKNICLRKHPNNIFKQFEFHSCSELISSILTEFPKIKKVSGILILVTILVGFCVTKNWLIIVFYLNFFLVTLISFLFLKHT